MTQRSLSTPCVLNESYRSETRSLGYITMQPRKTQDMPGQATTTLETPVKCAVPLIFLLCLISTSQQRPQPLIPILCFLILILILIMPHYPRTLQGRPRSPPLQLLTPRSRGRRIWWCENESCLGRHCSSERIARERRGGAVSLLLPNFTQCRCGRSRDVGRRWRGR